jgi:hypothetical protein
MRTGNSNRFAAGAPDPDGNAATTIYNAQQILNLNWRFRFMGLFDQVVGALNNPNQQASTDQLSSILNVVQQVAGQQGLNAGTTQTMMSVVGKHLRTALQEQQSQGAATEDLVSRFSGTQTNPDAVSAIFSNQELQATIAEVAQKTGINPQTVQSLLPMLVPTVLNLLQTGAAKESGQGGNSVLATFLDSDRDGDFDIGDAMSMASRFLQ